MQREKRIAVDVQDLFIGVLLWELETRGSQNWKVSHTFPHLAAEIVIHSVKWCKSVFT